MKRRRTSGRAKPRISALEYSAPTTAQPHDLWECRYFLHALPAAFTRENLEKLGSLERGPTVDIDTYVLGADARVNVKVRSRTQTIKVKHLLERLDDGFECWRTLCDTRLPAGTDVWDDVASRLSIRFDSDDIASLSNPHDAVRALCGSADPARCVEARKTRSFFRRAPAQVELTHVVIGEMVFHSIAFESDDLVSARSMRAELGGTALGTPENYITFCSRVL